jgi:hypothetical protein
MGFLAAVIVAFLIGVCVGLHPSWIPINVRSGPDMSVPDAVSTSSGDINRDARTAPPTTEATAEPATQP